MSFNSDIDISNFKVVSKKTLGEIEKEFFQKYKDIPVEFNWALVMPEDSEDVLKKKKLISGVKNQHLCGCCWAISCATAISDTFVVSGIVDWSPRISYTYALSKYPQKKCSGGSSRLLLEDIKNGGGIASETCVDDKWCLKNEKCLTIDPSKHFAAENKEYLSSLIPAEGCYDGNKKHYVYHIEDAYSLTVTDHIKVFEAQIKIKQHIMVRGPVVGGFLIMENFQSGDFTKVDKGIYFETADYNPAKDIVYSMEKDKILGSHSVVIVGWGISHNTKYNNIKTSIPYWYCRNSWGLNWGESGYFKIAMYPYNRICQFSKAVRVIHNKIIKDVGGVTGIKVTRPPILTRLKPNNYHRELYSGKNIESTNFKSVPLPILVVVFITFLWIIEA